MSEWEPPAVRYLCPIGTCPWASDDPGADVPEGETIVEDAASAFRAIMLRFEGIIRAHLETHSLLEWVTEVMRLRGQASGTVAVSREDLATVHAYARHFDVDDDPAMTRVREMLG